MTVRAALLFHDQRRGSASFRGSNNRLIGPSIVHA